MSEREEPHQSPALIDRSVKALIRAVPEALCRLAGVQADRRDIRFEDIALNLPELRADADRIRGGDLTELAPLLALCEDRPTEQTLREERELILGLDTTPEVRADLLAVALTVGLRYFARDVLERLFREELRMLKEVEFMRELFSDEFAEAEARGEARRARAMLRRILTQRFGELPETVVSQIEHQDPDWCESMTMRAITAQSLGELGLLADQPGHGAPPQEGPAPSD